MTPKQKADDLWFKFDEIIALNSWADEKTNIEELVRLPKKCALLLVDELLEATKRYDYTLGPNPSYNQYWLKVKYQLEQL